MYYYAGNGITLQTDTAGITEATVLSEEATFISGVLKIPFEFKTIEQEEVRSDTFVVNIA